MQPGVVRNGAVVNVQFDFIARGPTIRNGPIFIGDDIVGRENNEIYQIELLNNTLPASFQMQVTTITILDNDSESTIYKSQFMYYFIKSFLILHHFFNVEIQIDVCLIKTIMKGCYCIYNCIDVQ